MYAATGRRSLTSSTTRSRCWWSTCTPQREHFQFIARERAAGPIVVRAAIGQQIELIERELAADLAGLSGTDRWSAADLQVLANLIVTSVVGTAENIIVAGPDAEAAIVERARVQLRMVLIGALNWRSTADRELAGPGRGPYIGDGCVGRQVQHVHDRVGDGLGLDPRRRVVLLPSW